MPKKFTASSERPTLISLNITYNGGSNPVTALLSTTFETKLSNDADSNETLAQYSGAISFDALREDRTVSIGSKSYTIKQITNALLDLVNDVRSNPLP